MGWVVLVVAWVAVALLTARVADRRGHDRVLWLVLGFVFPVASLVALLLGRPRSQRGAGRLPRDVAEALHDSRVAAALAEQGASTADEVEAATGLDEGAVTRELRALRLFGLVHRGRDRRWELRPAAAAHLAGDPDGGRDTADGDG